MIEEVSKLDLNPPEPDVLIGLSPPQPVTWPQPDGSRWNQDEAMANVPLLPHPLFQRTVDETQTLAYPALAATAAEKEQVEEQVELLAAAEGKQVEEQALAATAAEKEQVEEQAETQEAPPPGGDCSTDPDNMMEMSPKEGPSATVSPRSLAPTGFHGLPNIDFGSLSTDADLGIDAMDMAVPMAMGNLEDSARPCP
jgi:hypothetical protein